MTKTRREFLRDAATVAGAAALSGCFPDVGGHWPRVEEACQDVTAADPLEGKGLVSEVHCEQSVVTEPGYALQAAHVRPMLDAVVLGLAPSFVELWKQVCPEFDGATRIGIKVNCLNAACPTSVPLVKALVDLLKESLGIGDDRIVVWDRRRDELRRCGFSEAVVGAQVVGTVNSMDDGGGPGYGDPICGVIAKKTPRLSRILTDLTDVTINVPVLKTHDVSGVTAAFKNIYGIIDNPADYHDNLVETMPQLYRLPPIRNRLRLHVLDAFQAVTTGGTSDPPDTVVKMLAASADPVALDNYSLTLVNRLRAERNIATLGPVNPLRLGWLEGARKLGLGHLEHDVVRRQL